VRPNNEAACEPVAVTDAGVGERYTRLGVAGYLVDIDGDAAIALLDEAFGLHVAGDRDELPDPITAYRGATDHATAFPGLRPVHIAVHQFDRSLDVSSVERRMGRAQQELSFGHDAQGTP
jgi:hypothetical protein